MLFFSFRIFVSLLDLHDLLPPCIYAQFQKLRRKQNQRLARVIFLLMVALVCLRGSLISLRNGLKICFDVMFLYILQQRRQQQRYITIFDFKLIYLRCLHVSSILVFQLVFKYRFEGKPIAPCPSLTTEM